jgi:anti-sigma regulatory factor (Ser/Thr protein kinase)
MYEIARVVEALDTFWAEHQVDEDAQADLNIAAEEILSNVIRHSESADGIELTVWLDPVQVRIQCVDSGAAFDPLQQATLDPDSPLESRRAGGMGLLMVRGMMDETHYERREDRNVFTMLRLRDRA